jgi:hypothetical protein
MSRITLSIGMLILCLMAYFGSVKAENIGIGSIPPTPTIAEDPIIWGPHWVYLPLVNK